MNDYVIFLNETFPPPDYGLGDQDITRQRVVDVDVRVTGTGISSYQVAYLWHTFVRQTW